MAALVVLNRARLWHKHGMVNSRARSDRGRKPLDAARLEELALAYVARFATSRAKLTRYLARKVRESEWIDDIDAMTACEAVADRMEQLRYLDDRQYAAMRAGAMTRRGLGVRRVKAQLYVDGIAEADLDAELLQVPDLLLHDPLREPELGDAVDHAPISFLGKEKKSIKTSFQMTGNKITFALSPYDNKKQLVIDPWVVFPPSPNSNKVWEVETDNSGNVYAYMGDSPFYLRKYNAAGSLQWSYSSSWDSSGFWVGGMVTHPNGDTYITTGSNGEIRKISPNGSLVWYNNPNSLTSYEYWSLAFNCDLTQLVVGGSRATFSIPFPVIRGTMMNINLANGAIANTTVVGFGNIASIPPRIQEASSICSSPNGNFYFLTLDTIGSINNSLTTVGFKIPTSYNFDYYIPGYGFGTKQPISATRANGNALYSHNGQTLHKRDLLSGAIVATASIPSGIINTLPIFG